MPFSFEEIYSYVSIVALLVMFPGPNAILVMQSVGVHGRRAGFLNVSGIVTAVYLNALISGLGLSLIIMQSTEIYGLMKMLGAGYIAYLGFISLVDGYKLHRQQDPTGSESNGVQGEAATRTEKSGLVFYSKGLLTGVLNPKSALFFLAFFPQFMHQDGNILIQSLILTVLYSLVSVTWYSFFVIFIGKLRYLLMRRKTQKWLRTVTGTILIGIGIKIAIQR
jgi:threonine/homoserine/homoserine lactone efflux protein